MIWFDHHAVTVVNGLSEGLLIYLTAAGLTLIFGLLDVLNLAHGVAYLFGSYIAYQLAAHGSFGLAIVAAVVVGAVLGGALNLSMVPLRRRGHLDQALLTIGAAFVLAGVATGIWGFGYHTVNGPSFLSGSVSILGHPFPDYRLAVIGVGVVVAAALGAVMTRTPAGRVVRAVVADREMASAIGVDVRRVSSLVFVAGTALATFAGVIGAPVIGVNPTIGDQILLLALVVTVIGGLGSLRGAFIGALIIGEVQSLGSDLVPAFAGFLVFATMAVVLIVRPQGLFGVEQLQR